ncbi:serine/threonine-protein kinase HipA [mine drainage metagenome]|uniref:Serine/threonine-protein kinase HipA n=1 Tax=mine drainage metagenome TaxID=410659 RepID=A0A1J5PC43_9ZZZZ
MRRLRVWWDGRPVGELTQDDGGELGFAYLPEWVADPGTPAVSASLPKRLEPFSRRECRPFFGGLLPEEGQRRAAAQALGISAANDFAMLDRLGGEVAGALQFLHPEETPSAAAGPWIPKPLDEEGLRRLLEALPQRPLLAGEGGLRLSLAGAQAKVPVVLVVGAVALPGPDQPTTHILKPSIPRFEATTENEAFVMRLAGLLGLEVAAVEARSLLASHGGRTFLLVRRYDRTLAAGGIRRLHQEDLCQALGIPVEQKYQSEGGPSLEQCFAVVRRVTARPATEVLKLLDAVIFNALAGNADAHGKNFSILYSETGPRLAPLYDLLCTVVYPELSPAFAMKIGRQARLENLDAEAWSLFAQQAGLRFPLVRRRVQELADLVLAKAQEARSGIEGPGLDTEALERFSSLVMDRAHLALQFIRKG